MNEHTSLRTILQGVLRPIPDRTAVVDLIHRCHGMALAYLRLKQSGGSWLPWVSGLAPEDTALDCIAELFRRSPQGSFTCVEAFFRNADTDGTMGESDLQIQLRRLVFGAVNHHLFRMYRDADPALSKIIRNIKLALKRRLDLLLTEQWGLQVLSPADIPAGKHHPPLCEPEVSAPLFHQRVSPRSSLTDMLTALGAVLHECDGGPCALPLVEAALLIREVHRQEVPDQADPGLPEALLRGDLERMIPEIVDRVRRNAGEGYRSSGKLTDQELEAHFNAVRDILTDDYIGPDGPGGTYLLHLGRHLTELTETLYRERHRVVLEYLTRTAKREARSWIAREWEFLQRPPDATILE